ALFADDAVLMLPGVPQLHGRAAIEQALAGAFGAVKYHSILANVQEVQFFGDYALEMGTSVFTYEAGGQTFVDQGKYVVSWKRQPGGEWKIHRDVSNVTSSSVQ
ncbi:MAG TPA: nuclear transport factor 2 family protein, partial [Longimicrobium sp.]|nr:nuclear transport factor 2 family protein [Longimicrobium sp.]